MISWIRRNFDFVITGLLMFAIAYQSLQWLR
jgi:hypothetical protein